MSSAHSSRATSRSRVRSASREPSAVYLPSGAEAFVQFDGQIGEQAAELLDEFVHPSHAHQHDETLVEVDHEPDEDADEEDAALIEEQRKHRASLPWWKRPSAWWFISIIPFSTMATTACLAPRIEILTNIVCRFYKEHRRPEPDWDSEGLVYSRHGGALLSLLNFPPAPVAHGPWSGDAMPAMPVSAAGEATTLTIRNNTLFGTDESKEHPACSSIPEVQAGVATILAAMATVMGVLSCFTTAFWTSLSDRYGRTAVLRVAMSGLLVVDVTFVVVTTIPEKIPGGYSFLLVGSFFEGLLGGLPTAIAAIHAYLADCSDASSRSRVFSLFLGLLFTGVAFGPTLGSLLVRLTDNLMLVFYVAFGVHFVLACYTWFLVPESMLPAEMAISRRKHAEDKLTRGRSRSFVSRFRFLIQFLTPLAVLSPMPSKSGASPHKQAKMDWSLILCALAYGISSMLMGAAQYVMQYTAAVYGWSSETIGYWLSALGAARAIFLTIVLPVVIKVFKPKTPAVQLPVSPSEPLDGQPPTSPPPSRSPSQSRSRSNSPAQAHSPAFDLSVARVSITIEVLAHALMLLSPSGPSFVGATCLNALGAGFSPTVQAVALELYKRRGGTESGKLFGALGVVQALSSQIVGPFLLGLVFINTVGTLPQALLMVLTGLLALATAMVLMVRLPPLPGLDAEDVEAPSPDDAHAHLQGETLVDVDVPAPVPEIVVKDVDAELEGDAEGGRVQSASSAAAAS